MKNLAITFALLTALLAACAPPLANGVFEAGKIVMRPGQSFDDVQSGSVLTFVEIVQDSRCPADATCVTSGFVQVLVEIEQGGTTQRMTLTLGDLAEGDVNSIPVAEWTVTLVEVNPYPLASAPVDYADYTITLDLQAD